VLDSAAARVDSEADPAVAGAIHASLANVYLGRGLPERAEHHARRALDALPTDDHARRGNALTSLAQALADAGRSADAEPYHEQSIALLREAGDERGLAVALNTYGVTLFNLGRTDEAEATYEQSLAILRRLDESAASTLNNLAILFTEQGRAEEATEVFDEMVADLRQQRTPGAAYSLGFALANRASALSNLNRADEALAGYREANAQFEDVLGPEHPETITSRVTLAFHLHRMGRFDDARREGAAALAMADSLLGDGHPYTAYAQTIAGAAYCDAGEPDRGAPLLRASLATRRTMVPADHWILANGESLLGGCLARLGRNEEASDLLQRSYDALRAALGPEHAKTQEARDRLRHHVGDGAVL
jgi:serine/threonine-protein kinase